MQPRDQHTHRLLTEIETSQHVSQRSLARRLGIALGLTNLLIRRVVRKGWVRVIQIKPNRVSYLLTPAGIAEKTRMSQVYLKNSISFYVEARTRIGDRLALLSAEWPNGSNGSNGSNGAEKRIVFFGTGELAEIGYVCLMETDLQLVGVVNDRRREKFFDVPVFSPADLSGCEVSGRQFDRIVVMAFDHLESMGAALHAAAVPPECIYWL